VHLGHLSLVLLQRLPRWQVNRSRHLSLLGRPQPGYPQAAAPLQIVVKVVLGAHLPPDHKDVRQYGLWVQLYIVARCATDSAHRSAERALDRAVEDQGQVPPHPAEIRAARPPSLRAIGPPTAVPTRPPGQATRHSRPRTFAARPLPAPRPGRLPGGRRPAPRLARRSAAPAASPAFPWRRSTPRRPVARRASGRCRHVWEGRSRCRGSWPGCAADFAVTALCSLVAVTQSLAPSSLIGP